MASKTLDREPSTYEGVSVFQLAAAATLAAVIAPIAAAQTVLDRSPNLAGAWVGPPGVLHFNFLHRFTTSDAPERKVTSTPTFLFAAGLPSRVLLGAHYATNSELSPRYPNEWELFGRVAPLTQQRNAPVDAAAQVGYNLAADGFDGEVSAARRQGPARFLAAVRLLSDPAGGGEGGAAFAAGVVLRLSRSIAIAGDVATLADRGTGEKVAWGAGVNLAIPRTPHTFSLHATNSNNATLQSASRGGDDVRYGFEFTIPLTLSRYFGPRRPPPAPTEQPADAVPPEPGAAAGRAEIQDFAFRPSRVEVAAGATVTFTNTGAVEHSVTADGGGFDSGLIQPGGRGAITFTTPGTYTFHCTPHPFMTGSVVVR
jgi:plastocyanin